MTQDEIKEALETCILGYCTGCPYDDCDGDCRDELHKDVLTLITEQEKEIERLKDDYAKLQEQFAQYQMASDKEMKAQRRQGQIDVLNRVMTYINDKIENDYGDMSDNVKYLTINIDDFDDFIDELIKEVQNEQKD